MAWSLESLMQCLSNNEWVNSPFVCLSISTWQERPRDLNRNAIGDHDVAVKNPCCCYLRSQLDTFHLSNS